MKVIHADHSAHVTIPGVAEPVQRPVSIDKPLAKLQTLRSLRIYRFKAGSVIAGHAEEDEVLIVVLAGSVELTLWEGHGQRPRTFSLAAVTEAPGQPCAAYLCPGGEYTLAPNSQADVAYARATPPDGPPPQVFRSSAEINVQEIALVLQEERYARLLRIRILRIKAQAREVSFLPLEDEAHGREALVHIRSAPEAGAVTVSSGNQTPEPLASWDSIAIAPGERPAVRIAEGSSALILIVFAG